MSIKAFSNAKIAPNQRRKYIENENVINLLSAGEKMFQVLVKILRQNDSNNSLS